MSRYLGAGLPSIKESPRKYVKNSKGIPCCLLALALAGVLSVSVALGENPLVEFTYERM